MNYFKHYFEEKPVIFKAEKKKKHIKRTKPEEIIKQAEEEIEEAEAEIEEKTEDTEIDTGKTKRRITIRNWLYKLNAQFKPFARFKYNKKKKYFSVRPTGEDDYLLIYPDENDIQKFRDDIGDLTGPSANEKVLDIMIKDKIKKKDVYKLIKNRAKTILKEYEKVEGKKIVEEDVIIKKEQLINKLQINCF